MHGSDEVNQIHDDLLYQDPTMTFVSIHDGFGTNGNSARKPILSICIPTYNRAELLRSALLSLAPQVKDTGEDVELIVSDNCSLDHTQEVVEWARQFGPIRYHRNHENLGLAGNFMLVTNELATGEFGWIIPDDDVARPDAVRRVLTVLKSHSEVDYVFVNVSPRSATARHAFDRPVTGADFPELLPTKAKSLIDRYIEQWDELIDPDVDEVFLGSAMCSVFRLSLWNKHRLALNPADRMFSSLKQTYPHSVVLAHTMRGRPAYYIGYPCVITFWGEQEWMGSLPMLILVRLQELLDQYQSLDIDRQRIGKCRRVLLGYSNIALSTMLFTPNTPGCEYFSFRRFLWQNRNHPFALFKLMSLVTIRRSQPLYIMLRWLRRKKWNSAIMRAIDRKR
jgi:glycosyltransferase involved in cell wall biosynthesis